jgi:hypothetical protein
VGTKSHQSIIELNGQRYNARTGRLIDGVHSIISAKPTPPSGKRPSPSRQHTASHQIHKKPEPSHTLMRRAVKKPSLVTNHQVIAMDVVDIAPARVRNESFRHISPDRNKRARAIPKNSLISRFGDITTGQKHQVPQLSAHIQPAVIPVRPSAPSVAAAPAHHASKSNVNKVLDRGLHEATSHHHAISKQRLHHKVGHKLGLSSRAASIAASSLAVLTFGAFFAYQNIPSINVRYAAAKAGVQASLPDYRPAGFAVSNRVQYSPGRITISYSANADNRQYTLSQQNTSWNSQALKDHLASTDGMTPQSYPDNGRTIYLHDDSSADWVEEGVWYSISGDASLNTDQLIKIASSI